MGTTGRGPGLLYPTRLSPKTSPVRCTGGEGGARAFSGPGQASGTPHAACRPVLAAEFLQGPRQSRVRGRRLPLVMAEAGGRGPKGADGGQLQKDPWTRRPPPPPAAPSHDTCHLAPSGPVPVASAAQEAVVPCSLSQMSGFPGTTSLDRRPRHEPRLQMSFVGPTPFFIIETR